MRALAQTVYPKLPERQNGYPASQPPAGMQAHPGTARFNPLMKRSRRRRGEFNVSRPLTRLGGARQRHRSRNAEPTWLTIWVNALPKQSKRRFEEMGSIGYVNIVCWRRGSYINERQALCWWPCLEAAEGDLKRGFFDAKGS
jgi:hypothetical protein